MNTAEQLAAAYSIARWRYKFARWRLAKRQRELAEVEQRIDDYQERNLVMNETIEKTMDRTGLSKSEVTMLRARITRQGFALLLAFAGLCAHAAPPLPPPTKALTPPTISTNQPFLVSTAPALPPIDPVTYSVALAWDKSPDPTVTGYRIYRGVTVGGYTNSFSVGNRSNATVSGLLAATTYHFAATAYDAAGTESDFSNDVAYDPGILGSIQVGAWRYSNPGYTGKTNEIVESTDGMKTWHVLKTFVGDGTAQTVVATNYVQAQYRVRLKGKP